MNLKFIIKDEKGVVGPAIPLTQGESKTLSVFWFNEDGSPYVAPSITALLVKIYSSINQGSIQKSLAGSTVTLLQCTQLGGYIGFQFSLLATDTPNMTANNSGLPVSFFITDASSNVTEGDILNAFDVSIPAVIT